MDQRKITELYNKSNEEPAAKTGGFKYAYLTFVLALLTIAVVALGLLWLYLSAYEKYRPEDTVQKFVDEQTAEYWEDMAEGSKVTLNEFEDFSEIEDLLSDVRIDPAEISVQKRLPDYSKEAPKYTVFHGDRELAVLTLEKVKSHIFGVTEWEITDVSPANAGAGIEGQTLTFTVPESVDIFINGKQVSDQYIAESENASYSCPFEPDGTQIIKYVVKDILGGPEIVMKQGEDLVSYNVEGTDFAAAGINGDISRTIVIPEGYTLKLNGIEVDDSYITERNVGHELLDGAIKFNDTVPTYNKYVISGMSVAPEITVFDEKDAKVQLESNMSGVLRYNLQSNDLMQGQYEETAKDFVDTYFRYAYSGPDNASQNLNDALYLTLANSDAEALIKESYEGIVWNSYRDITYHEFYAENFVVYDENSFSCNVVYDAETLGEGITNYHSGTFHLLFVFNAWGAYRVTRMLTE